MAKWSKDLGLNKSARNPTAIANLQHDDKSSSARNLSGSPGTYFQIISNAATAQKVPDHCVLRVANTTATVQYLAIEKQADIPGGAPAIGTGLALAPNSVECIFLGKLEGNLDTIFIKASDNGVQVAVMEL